jgi:DNA-binding GntR family transcriptional regulator
VRFVLNRGAFVAGLSVRDIVEIYQLREQLESFAAHIAATEMSVGDVDALERELAHAQKVAAKGQAQETFESDVHLHKQLIQCTKNSRIMAILATIPLRRRHAWETQPGRDSRDFSFVIGNPFIGVFSRGGWNATIRRYREC